MMLSSQTTNPPAAKVGVVLTANVKPKIFTVFFVSQISIGLSSSG
jgi:hypothetical protein